MQKKKQIYHHHRDGFGSIVGIGKHSRAFSIASFGDDHKEIAYRFYVNLGKRLGYFHEPEKANQFFVRPSSSKCNGNPVVDLCRYVLSDDGLYSKVEVFRKYRSKDAEERALIDLNFLSKQ